MKKSLVFGEVLYDIYPTHKKIGGAPLNFGAHFARLGGKSYLCSAVGGDSLGEELISEVNELGVDTSLVSVKKEIPTAYCKVTYHGNEPIYTLPLGVSYDFITCKCPEESFELLYFGTLAARSEASLATLRSLLTNTDVKVRFFDINLRQSFYSCELVKELLGYSDAVKLNRDEYEYCNSALGINAPSVEDFSKKLSELFGLCLVIVTLDKDGSAVFDRESGEFLLTPIKEGRFVSAVGAGDSFSACFMYNYLSGAPIEICAEKATSLASLVVGVEAAVPEYDADGFVYKKIRRSAMLKIVGFTKTYGEKCAVDNLSLEIASGEICAFIGHNGAGKTTTLKACIGILDFDEGDIFINGVSVKRDSMYTKSVTAYIPDNPDLYSYLSGIKYLNFVADVFGVSVTERNEKINLYAEKLGLTKDLGEKIGAYSHGMKQKLAIIAAWLHSPKLILMDEPFVGLDPRAAHTLKEMMREHCDNGGSIFFSTHVLDVAEKLCDKVAIIKGGKLVVTGSMESVKGDASLEEIFLELEEEEE